MTTRLNQDLVGVPGGALALQTPALVMDLDRFERNLGAMMSHCRQHGIRLRPHSKTHKCSEIARRQIAAGAVGICCAKLGEAEAMADGGIERILITSPVVQAKGIERLTALNRRLEELIVVVDHPRNLIDLAAASSASKIQRVMLDLDPGMHRTGMPMDARAIELARALASNPHLQLVGLQCYAGNLMHVENYDKRKYLSNKVMVALDEVRRTLAASGVTVPVLSGGGTGTFDIDADSGVLNELQAGSYIFMDRQYNEVGGAGGKPIAFETSLLVQMSVVSSNTDGIATTDAGFKSFSTDADAPLPVHGIPDDATFAFRGDEHGALLWQGANERLEPGHMIRAITPHCDPTINLHDLLHVIRGDELVDIWDIDARGRSA